MSRKQELKGKIEELTNAEIVAAIRYLDPELPQQINGEKNGSRENQDFVFGICIVLMVLVLGCLGLILALLPTFLRLSVLSNSNFCSANTKSKSETSISCRSPKTYSKKTRRRPCLDSFNS